MKALGLPDKIKLGHEDIAVEYSSEFLYNNARFARTILDAQRITIDSLVHGDVQKEYLFSNIHWFLTARVGVDLSEGERNSLAVGMFAVLRDNPALLRSASVDRVRVGGQEIDVTVVDNCDASGTYDPKTLRIEVNSATTSIKRRHVLFHEIYHILWNNLFLDTEKSQERDIDCMAWMLTMLLVENNFDWLLRKNDEVVNESRMEE